MLECFVARVRHLRECLYSADTRLRAHPPPGRGLSLGGCAASVRGRRRFETRAERGADHLLQIWRSTGNLAHLIAT